MAMQKVIYEAFETKDKIVHSIHYSCTSTDKTLLTFKFREKKSFIVDYLFDVAAGTFS